MAAPQILQPTESGSGWGEVPALAGNVSASVPDPTTGVSATSTQQSATATTQAVVQAQVVPPVPASVPLMDPNGYISQTWAAYFQALMRRIGGYSDTPWEDLWILGQQDTQQPDGTARDMAQLAQLEVPQTPRPVDGDPFALDRVVKVPDEDPFSGVSYPPLLLGRATPTAPGTAAAGDSHYGSHENHVHPNPLTTLGDLLVGGASGVQQRLGVGGAGTVLTISSGVPAWVAPSGGGLNYSTTEQSTGTTWTDGKTIYMKVVTIASLPNATNGNYAHGITGLSRVVYLTGAFVGGVGSNWQPLPYVYTSAAGCVSVDVDATNIIIGDSVNQSSRNGWVILYYTK